jgi:plasmid stability protein
MLQYATKYAILLIRKEPGMNILHVRRVPDDLYHRLQQLAAARNRSLSAQVVMMLIQGLEEEERRRQQGTALTAICRRRFTPPAKSPSSLQLLHEDRER